MDYNYFFYFAVEIKMGAEELVSEGAGTQARAYVASAHCAQLSFITSHSFKEDLLSL